MGNVSTRCNKHFALHCTDAYCVWDAEMRVAHPEQYPGPTAHIGAPEVTWGNLWRKQQETAELDEAQLAAVKAPTKGVRPLPPAEPQRGRLLTAFELGDTPRKNTPSPPSIVSPPPRPARKLPSVLPINKSPDPPPLAFSIAASWAIE